MSLELLIMLTIRRRHFVMKFMQLIYLFIMLTAIASSENNSQLNFVTHQENPVRLKMILRNEINTSPQNYEFKFSTKQFKPRPLKYQMQQQQVENEDGSTTMEAVTTEDTVTDNDATTTLMPTEAALTQPNMESVEDMMMLSTTPMPLTTSPKPTSTTSSPSTTRLPNGVPHFPTASPSTYPIMRPSSYFPFNLKEKLKNFFITTTPIAQSRNRTKTKGFFSLFEIIRFENKPCQVSVANIRSMEGICYHELECKKLGGILTEPCAHGAGVCCIFLTGCGDTTRQLVTYFESPNYPKSVQEISMCVLIINLRENIQQLLLDFIAFELSRPTNGDCLDDQFNVSGQDINFPVPTLCGLNNNQHLYIHVQNSLNRKVYITITSRSALAPRLFNIKITQLSENLAPDGCLQYFMEPEGTIKSFNYDIIGSVVDNTEATYFNNLNYAVCIKRQRNYCTVLYKMEPDPYLANRDANGQINFQIVNKDEDGNDIVPSGQAGAGIFNCADDFIAINQVRLCGERFNDGAVNDDFTMNAAIRDVAAGPIILPFRTNHLYVGRGFRLTYKQELCI